MRSFIIVAGLLAVPFFLTSCATPTPPQAFHNTDNSALIVASLDAQHCQIISPVASGKETDDEVLAVAKKMPQHQTAIVILENYTEAQPGNQFSERSTDLFVGLRSVGYERVVFLHGNGGTSPEGLVTVADY
jgi:hypothetical protein